MAAAHRRSVTQETIHLIEAALASEGTARVAEAPTSYWATRKLLPEFEEALKADAFSRGTDSTEIYSIDRHLLAAASVFGLKGVNVVARVDPTSWRHTVSSFTAKTKTRSRSTKPGTG